MLSFVFALIISVLATALFLKGFFLTRRELHELSACDLASLKEGLPDYGATPEEKAVFDDLMESLATDGSCWGPSSHKRVLLFIVDALRLDFMTTSSGQAPGLEAFMPRMHDLLTKNASQTRFFGFHADPPTVTAQRLKGLTAGSLPTFVDIGSNFNSTAVLEDTWLGQLYSRRGIRGRSSGEVRDVHMGDDTWQGLFPSRFEASWPFPSFDTHDLDTVDDGIEALLLPTLRKQPPHWDLFVAHFLGVDHIGHTHSAWHPMMGERLRRMDDLLVEVAKALPEDTLLLCFGDHGMTDGGNHGGATSAETDSGLFVYSKRPLAAAPSAEWEKGAGWVEKDVEERVSSPRMVNQVDLVPTLSLVLGLPIPFSSLGTAIPELVSTSDPGDLSRYWLVNSLQVLKYLRRYDATGAVLPANVVKELETLLRSAIEKHHSELQQTDGDVPVEQAQLLYSTFLQAVLQLGRQLFTQFDLTAMWVGAAALLISLVLLVWPLAFVRVTGRCLSVTDPGSIYVAAVAHWGLGHAAAGISDNGINYEAHLHSVAVPILAVLGQRALGSRLDSPHPMLQAGLAVLACVLLPKWLGAGGKLARGCAYSVTCFIIYQGMCLARPEQLGRRLTRLSAWLFAVSCVVAGAHFAAEPGSPLSVNCAKASMCMSVICIAWLLSTKGVVQSTWYVHCAAHYCNLLSIVTGPLLLPLLLTMGMHFYYAATGVLFCTGRIWVPPGNARVVGMMAGVHVATVFRAAFFASGHELNFGALDARAGLVGIGHFNYWWAALMLALNTFGLEVLLMLLCIPWLATVQRALPRDDAEMIMLQAFACYRVLVLLVSCLTAIELRRHLMVWAVFAPKLAFEAAFWGVQCPLILLLCLWRRGRVGPSVEVVATSAKEKPE